MSGVDNLPGNGPEPKPAARAIVLGLTLAVFAVLLAFFPAGAGHGWGAPFVYSLPLFVIYPIVMLRAWTRRHDTALIDAAMVALALAADIALVLSAISYREAWLPKPSEILPGVNRSVFPMFLLWLAIWLHWQFVVVRTLIRRLTDAR